MISTIFETIFVPVLAAFGAVGIFEIFHRLEKRRPTNTKRPKRARTARRTTASAPSDEGQRAAMSSVR